MRKILEVINSTTNEVVRRIDVSGQSASAIETLDNNVVRNMSIEFHTRLVEEDEPGSAPSID